MTNLKEKFEKTIETFEEINAKLDVSLGEYDEIRSKVKALAMQLKEVAHNLYEEGNEEDLKDIFYDITFINPIYYGYFSNLDIDDKMIILHYLEKNKQIVLLDCDGKKMAISVEGSCFSYAEQVLISYFLF